MGFPLTLWGYRGHLPGYPRMQERTPYGHVVRCSM